MRWCISFNNSDECTDVTKNGFGGTCIDTAGVHSCDCEEVYIEDGAYSFKTCITIDKCESGSFYVADCGQGNFLTSENTILRMQLY